MNPLNDEERAERIAASERHREDLAKATEQLRVSRESGALARLAEFAERPIPSAKTRITLRYPLSGALWLRSRRPLW